MNALALRIRELTAEKVDFVSDEAEGVVDGIIESALSLDDAADNFSALAGEDSDQEEVANSLVDLADIFDDVNLAPAQEEKLNRVVSGLLKSGTPEQIQAGKDLFTATLAYGQKAKSTNEFFDDLLKPEPTEPPEQA